ncbi:hypothetical protein BpHYR1_025162, partial [Brachionus plicatilis]
MVVLTVSTPVFNASIKIRLMLLNIDNLMVLNLRTILNNITRHCWAAAKPGRSERGQKKAATLAARPAAKNLDRR